LLNVESSIIILALSSLVSFVASVVVVDVDATGVVIVAAVVGGSLCYYTSANQQSWDRRS
jgi:uncharacterized membrane-anchored protein